MLNRFSNNLNEAEWVERLKDKLVQVIDSEWPLDMTLILTMFGKYPEYKTLFPKFETSISNTVFKIKLMLSELHTNLLPK